MIKNDFLIKETDSLLFDQIERIRGRFSEYITEVILVEAKKNPKTKTDLEYILRNGFVYNSRRYFRFGKSASQAKDGITAFVCADIYEELYKITQLEIQIDCCVISKYESQRCLPFSSCTLIKDYNPKIVIIGEYTKEIKNQLIKYVVENEKPFIDKNTGEEKTYKAREIAEGYRDITISPFDGCGCHEKEFSEMISKTLDVDYLVAGAQIRKPYMKGYSVYAPFRRILRDMGVSTITDVYGKSHNVDEIDCIWNTTMFKGHKSFYTNYGTAAWDKYCEVVEKYIFPLGISKYSHHVKNINLMARMNFQYLQCLDLSNPKYVDWFNDKSHPKYDILDENNNGKIVSIAKYTTDLFEKIISGNKFYTYKFMGILCTNNYIAESNYFKAALTNDIMLKDIAVKQFIYRKLKKSIQEAKIGKIYTSGFYHTVVGDMIGYLQYAACKEVIGCLKKQEFYCETLPKGKVLSFRSPLVCPSEVNEVALVAPDAAKKYLGHFKDQDIVMLNMYDLSLPQQGGMDEDGDAVFLCNDPIIIGSRVDKSIIIDIEDKITTKEVNYDLDHLVEYEMNTRDNRIGEITNVATGIENRYTTDVGIKKAYADFTSLLRIIQGKEIDYLKTGVRWQMNKGLRKYGQQIPWFLLFNYPKKLKHYEKIKLKNKTNPNKKEHIPLNAFRSPSPMNELCDYICTWETKKLIWNNSVVDTRCLILDNNIDLSDKKIIKQIRNIINSYANDSRRIFQSGGVVEYGQLDILLQYYKTKLAAIIQDEKTLANYIIKVSYLNNSINKSLAWNGYGEYIVRNLSENSNPKKHISITETPYKTNTSCEYLGKHYEMRGCGENI